MNENIDLTKILKDCPEDTKFYCSICGEVTIKIKTNYTHPIHIYQKAIYAENPILICRLSIFGKYNKDLDGECILFPSKEQRDWSKFERFQYKPKVEKFDINTLKPFDKVLVRDTYDGCWTCELFSHIDNSYKLFSIICISAGYKYCIPYNDETKHLVGITDDCPEHYKWWKE